MRRSIVSICLLAASLGPHLSRADDSFWWANVIWTVRVDFPSDPDMLARCDYVLRGSASSTILGEMIPLPVGITGGTTKFHAIDGLMGGLDGVIAEPANIDVSFFERLGSCGPTAEPPVVLARFFGPSEEAGVIPAGARFALVTLASKPSSAFIFETVR